jgi:hypothetical protein
MQKRPVLVVIASLLVAGGAATAQEPSPGMTLSADAASTANPAALPPDGTWQVTLSDGVYTWTFADGRAAITLVSTDGPNVGCTADMTPEGDAVRFVYDGEGGCGGEVDVIRWALADDGLHLSLVSTNAFDQVQAYLGAKPWQRVGGSAVVCPTPDGGGACLGPLEPGTYRTTLFETPFSFSVPAGWDEAEDFPGDVLLLPPGSQLAGVGPETSDYVIIAQGVGVGVERGTASDCDTAQPGVGLDPASMVAALAAHEGIIVSDPVPVEIGGLPGLMIDVADDPASDVGCVIPELGTGTFPGLIVGVGPAGFTHVQGPGYTTRLYLLDRGDTNIVIEVADVTDARGTADDYAPVIESIEFAAVP